MVVHSTDVKKHAKIVVMGSFLLVAAAIHTLERNILSAQMSIKIPSELVCPKLRATIPSQASKEAEANHIQMAVTGFEEDTYSPTNARRTRV